MHVNYMKNSHLLVLHRFNVCIFSSVQVKGTSRKVNQVHRSSLKTFYPRSKKTSSLMCFSRLELASSAKRLHLLRQLTNMSSLSHSLSMRYIDLILIVTFHHVQSVCISLITLFNLFHSDICANAFFFHTEARKCFT